MAQSIARSQSRLLDSGYLDGLGSAKDEGLEVDETLQALAELAKYIIDQARDNLNKGKHTGSGKLADSFTVLDPEVNGDVVTLAITALDYYDYLNAGVKGTKSGSGKYSFKNTTINKTMLFSIRKWLIRKGLKQRQDRSYLKSKGIKTIEDTSNRAAYAIATHIKQKGIKPTGYFTEAIQAGNEYAKSILGKALVIDVINSLPKTI